MRSLRIPDILLYPFQKASFGRIYPYQFRSEFAFLRQILGSNINLSTKNIRLKLGEAIYSLNLRGMNCHILVADSNYPVGDAFQKGTAANTTLIERAIIARHIRFFLLLNVRHRIQPPAALY